MAINKTNIKKEISDKTKSEIRPAKEQEAPVRDHQKSNNTKRTINRTSKRPDKPYLIL